MPTPRKQKARRLQPAPRLTKRSAQALKAHLDQWVAQYKTPAFIPNDPIQFPHRFRETPQTCEWIGLLAALFSYGRRDKILETVDWMLTQMGPDPEAFLGSFRKKTDTGRFAGFVYRFNREGDILALLERFQRIYQEYGSIEAFFIESAKTAGSDTSLQARLGAFMEALIDLGDPPSPGLKFLLAHPARGGACKRLHMYLRWMVRQDEDPASRVDFGLWERGLSPGQLLMPLDTHVAQMARQLGLTNRNANDWQTAEEITAVFRRFCPSDPVRYDFALFGYNSDAETRALRKALATDPLA
jgi:uncharacterized protein (TIGR02757 family)